jgi:ABC-2 type transport system ATP-binding protein
MGKTILVSSHILHELAQICTRIGIIEAGSMVAEGSLEDIYRQLDLRRAIHVQLSNLSDDLLESAEAIEGVASVERHVDRLCFRIREEQLSVEELLEKLQSLGGRVYMFQPEAMDMETAFMKLTEGKTA